MEFTVSPADNGRYIITTVVGEITRDLAPKFIGASAEEGARLGVNRFLCDVTQARNTESVVGNVRVRRDVVPELVSPAKPARISILAAPGDTSHDFFVAFAKSQGINMTVFWDRDEAIAHLVSNSEDTAAGNSEPA